MTPLLPSFTPARFADVAQARDRVYCCDALALLKSLPDASVDAVITDPPYGLAGRVFDFPHRKYTAVNEEWDIDVPTQWMAACERVLKPGGSVVCFGGRQSIYEFAAVGLRLGWRIVNDITWYKPDAAPNFTGRMMTESTERALWFCPSGSNWTYNLNAAKEMNGGVNFRDVWELRRMHNDIETRTHPTQKPLDLMLRIVRLFTNEGDTIVDPFFGSGTTGDAARRLGRHYIGGDITSKYVNAARERLSRPFEPPQATLPMFTEVPA